jgi:phosphatidate cytidylyltransferase
MAASTREGRPRAERPRRQRRERRGSEPPKRKRSDLLARVLVAVPAAVLAIVFVDLGGIPWATLMIVMSLLCLIELYEMIARWHPIQIVGFAGAVAMVIAAHFGNVRDVLEVAVITVPVTFLAVAAAQPRGMATVRIAGTLLGIWWIGMGFAHAELLRGLPHGNSIIIDVMVGTFLGDAGAYLGGRLFGRRPLAPEISPNKTVEGLLCGMFVAVLSVFIAGQYQPWMTKGDALLLGLAIAVLAPIGDLFESMVKRDAGMKDSGSIFGPHGGALDRLDAIIFTIVAGYYVWIGIIH